MTVVVWSGRHLATDTFWSSSDSDYPGFHRQKARLIEATADTPAMLVGITGNGGAAVWLQHAAPCDLWDDEACTPNRKRLHTIAGKRADLVFLIPGRPGEVTVHQWTGGTLEPGPPEGAIGSGGYVALGVLFVTRKAKVEERLATAVAAACEYVPACKIGSEGVWLNRLPT